uniref:ACB domain-containing protein n=1 Tax=Salarias fasciatus TaxID=181472 RepID=A0A672HHI5_SALFA
RSSLPQLKSSGVYLKKVKPPSDDMMLMFYSYYKQATLGPCDVPRPTGFWDTRGKAKWSALRTCSRYACDSHLDLGLRIWAKWDM